MVKITQEKFKNSLPGSYGIQAVIAKKLLVSRSAITQYLNKNPKLKELCLQEREKIIDVSENRLFKAADNGEKWAVDKILSTIGKNRGYVETQNLDHSGGFDNKLIVEVVELKKSEDEDPDDNSLPTDG